MKIDLPTIVMEDDYHEFSHIVDILCAFGADVEYEECGFSDGYYRAIFYAKGNKRSLQKFKKNQEKRSAWKTGR